MTPLFVCLFVGLFGIFFFFSLFFRLFFFSLKRLVAAFLLPDHVSLNKFESHLCFGP